MSFRKITNEGENFIKFYCSDNKENRLKGRNKNNPLPFQLLGTGKPELSPDYIWEAKPLDDSGNIIKTNSSLGESLIKWYNYYAKQYDLDANILAAQAFVESNYNLWAYTSTESNSSAGGISQFTVETLVDVVLKNKYDVLPKFTEEEISKIFTLGKDPNNYLLFINGKVNETGWANRALLHHNVIDNPKIMIKAQCRLMKILSIYCNYFANWTLFCYNAGIGFSKYPNTNTPLTFPQAIEKLKSKRPNNYNEAVMYVFKIFSVLGDRDNVNTKIKSKGIWFGYEPSILNGINNQNVNMNVAVNEQLKYFDANNVDIIYSNNIGT